MRSITDVNPSSEVLIALLEELNSLEDDTILGVCFSLTDYTWGKSININVGSLWDSENDEREDILTCNSDWSDERECLVRHVSSRLLELSAYLNKLATTVLITEEN